MDSTEPIPVGVSPPTQGVSPEGDSSPQASPSTLPPTKKLPRRSQLDDLREWLAEGEWVVFYDKKSGAERTMKVERVERRAVRVVHPVQRNEKGRFVRISVPVDCVVGRYNRRNHKVLAFRERDAVRLAIELDVPLEERA